MSMNLTERRIYRSGAVLRVPWRKDEYLPTAELNALALEAKTDKAAAVRLWDEVERFAYWITDKYRHPDNVVLMQGDYQVCAFLGFTAAIKYFDPLKSGFLSALKYAVRGACWHEYQRMCVKSINAVSLDAPIRRDNGDGGAIVDFIPDEAAGTAFDKLLIEDIARIILDEARTMPNLIQSRIIFECIYKGRPLASLADEIGISRQGVENHQQYAITYLRRRPVIRAIQKEFFRECKAARHESALDPYRTKSTTAVKNDFTSIIESIVLRLEE